MSESFNSVDFEIEKKGLARKVALLVNEFVVRHSLRSIDVSVFLTEADVSLTEIGDVEYGRMLHCVIDTNLEEEEDYE